MLYYIFYLFIHHKAVATNFANCWAQAWRWEAAGTLHNSPSPILHGYLGCRKQHCSTRNEDLTINSFSCPCVLILRPGKRELLILDSLARLDIRGGLCLMNLNEMAGEIHQTCDFSNRNYQDMINPWLVGCHPKLEHCKSVFIAIAMPHFTRIGGHHCDQKNVDVTHRFWTCKNQKIGVSCPTITVKQ